MVEWKTFKYPLLMNYPHLEQPLLRQEEASPRILVWYFGRKIVEFKVQKDFTEYNILRKDLLYSNQITFDSWGLKNMEGMCD